MANVMQKILLLRGYSKLAGKANDRLIEAAILFWLGFMFRETGISVPT